MKGIIRNCQERVVWLQQLVKISNLIVIANCKACLVLQKKMSNQQILKLKASDEVVLTQHWEMRETHQKENPKQLQLKIQLNLIPIYLLIHAHTLMLEIRKSKALKYETPKSVMLILKQSTASLFNLKLNKKKKENCQSKLKNSKKKQRKPKNSYQKNSILVKKE